MYFEHNIEIFQKFEPIILEHHECCLVGTMGTGKTDISIEFIKKYNQKALIIVPSVYLGNQWKEIAEKNDISTLTVVTYHTFSKAFAVLSVGYDCYIFDEAHHMDSPVWGKAIRKFREMIDDDKYIIGLTGDPIRYFDSCKNVVDTMFHGHVAYGLTQYEAIMDGILPNVIYVCAIYDTKGLYDKYKTMATTKHLQGKLNLAYENCKKINDILVAHAIDNMKGFVFVDKIESIGSGVDLISKAFPDMPVYSAHSKMAKNEKFNNIKDFKDSDTGFMVSVNMFNEGHHVSGTNTTIMLRKTGSPTIYAQQIGRALSANHSGTAIVYDFVANSESIKSIGKRISTITATLEGELNKYSSKRNDRISNQVIIYDHSRDFLEVLEEIDRFSSMVWSPEEDKIIIDNYPTMGSYVYKLLPGRTRNACVNRACYLKILCDKRGIAWSDEEIQILKDNYPSLGCDVIKLLPGRTKTACKFRARMLGIKYTNSWTQEEDKILIDNYPTIGSDVYKLLPSRTKTACSIRASILNIKINNDWTQEEDKIIINNYPIMGAKRVKDLLPPGKLRSTTAIINRAKELGVVNNRYWTQEEDKILIDNYPTMGSDVYKLLPGRTAMQCEYKADKLKLHSNNRKIRWTQEEDKILIDNYPTMGSDVYKLLPSRTKSACRQRIAALIKKDKL